MSAAKIVRTFITALQSGDLDMAASYMTDDFVCSGWAPESLDKGLFLAMQSELHAAMPDYTFNLSEVHEEDGMVTALIQVSGTHTRDLSLPMFGIPLVPYTGMFISLPQVHAEFVLAHEKVREMRVESVLGGGLTGLLQQMDTELLVLPRLREFRQLGDTDYAQEIEEHEGTPPWQPESPVIDENAG